MFAAGRGSAGQHGDTTPYPQAPELWVEMLSPSNSPGEIEDNIHLQRGFASDQRAVIIGIGIGIETSGKRPDLDPDFQDPRRSQAASKLDSSASIRRPQAVQFGYGTREAWTVNEAGWISLFGPEGKRQVSALPGITGQLAT